MSLPDNAEKDWFHDYDYVIRTFASSSIPSWKPTLIKTKQGWYLAWRDMVSLCSRALEYKDEAERRAKHLEDKLRTKQIAEATNEYKKMVKSFDELGEKYTKDMDALMKLLILLGRKIDE